MSDHSLRWLTASVMICVASAIMQTHCSSRATQIHWLSCGLGKMLANL